MEINKLTSMVINAAIEVHRALGPGLLESTYEECLVKEFTLRHVPFERQKQLPIVYKGMRLDCGYRLDFLINKELVVELKAVDILLPIHRAQVLTYLRLGNWKIGLLINFNVPVLKMGIKRLVLGLEENQNISISARSASLR